MSNIFTYAFSLIFVLGVMVLVHEWGHFIAARLFGVRVEIFSLGFGPRVWGRKRGSTDYRISALPLGGYVKMAGDNPSEEREGAPDEFLSKPRWQRSVIAVAGPAMNLLMAIVLLAGSFFFVGVPYPRYLDQPVDIAGLPKNSFAAAAGIRPGDRIVEVNGIKNPTWKQIYVLAEGLKAGAAIQLAVERNGEYRSLNVAVPTSLHDADDLVDRAFGYPALPAIVEEVAPGLPADKAGLKPGDEILALNEEPIRTWAQLVVGLRHSGGQNVRLLVRRGNQHVTLDIRPMQGQNERNEPTWQIGVMRHVDFKRLSFGPAFQEASLTTWNFSRQIVSVVGQLFTGKVSLRQMQSVIGIVHESGRAAKRGWPFLLNWMAVISVNLAILNLLPIPILDGGHVLMLAIEGVLRHDLSVTVKERFVQVGMVFLLVVIAFVMYNDVVRLLPSH